MKPNEQDWSSLPDSSKAIALGELTNRLIRILETYFSGYFSVESEHFNRIYVSLRRIIEMFAPEFPAVHESLVDLFELMPNLYEAIGDEYSADEDWELADPILAALRARMSQTLVETGAALESTSPSFIDELLPGLDSAIDKFEKAKRKRDSELLRRAEKKAERYHLQFAGGHASRAGHPTLTNSDELAFQRHGCKSRLPIQITGRTEARMSNVLRIDNSEVFLTDKQLRLFLRFVVALFETDDGYVTREALKHGKGTDWEGELAPEGLDQAISRIRTRIRPVLKDIDPKDFLQCHRKRLRISTHKRYVFANREKLLNHDDRIIRLLAERLPVKGRRVRSMKRTPEPA